MDTFAAIALVVLAIVAGLRLIWYVLFRKGRNR